jgi:hypothetical protein
MRRLPGLEPNPLSSRGSAASAPTTMLIVSSAAHRVRHPLRPNARITIRIKMSVAAFRRPAPQLSGQYFPARRNQRNFGDQLLDEQVAKRIEVLCDQDKSAGPADHVVSVVFFEPTRRIRMLRTPRKSRVRENDQAVDCNTSRNCFVSRQAHITAAVVVAVSRRVDRTPLVRSMSGNIRTRLSFLPFRTCCKPAGLSLEDGVKNSLEHRPSKRVVCGLSR